MVGGEGGARAGVAEPVLAVHLGGVMPVYGEGERRAPKDRDLIRPRGVEDDADVADDLVYVDVAAEGRDRGDSMGRAGEGQQDGDGVIHAGVRVDDQAGDHGGCGVRQAGRSGMPCSGLAT